MGGVDRYIGEQVLVTHRDGIGVDLGVGYNNMPMVIMGMVQNHKHVTLEALIVNDILNTSLNGLVVLDEDGNVVPGNGGGWGWDTWPT